MTAWNPEPIPDEDGQSMTPAIGVGVALALVPHAAAGAVRLVPPGPSGSHIPGHGTVFELADFLERPGNATCWGCPMLGGGYLELKPGAVAAALPLAA